MQLERCLSPCHKMEVFHFSQTTQAFPCSLLDLVWLQLDCVSLFSPLNCLELAFQVSSTLRWWRQEDRKYRVILGFLRPGAPDGRQVKRTQLYSGRSQLREGRRQWQGWASVSCQKPTYAPESLVHQGPALWMILTWWCWITKMSSLRAEHSD